MVLLRGLSWSDPVSTVDIPSLEFFSGIIVASIMAPPFEKAVLVLGLRAPIGRGTHGMTIDDATARSSSTESTPCR